MRCPRCGDASGSQRAPHGAAITMMRPSERAARPAPEAGPNVVSPRFADVPAARRRVEVRWPSLGTALGRATRNGVIRGLEAMAVVWDELMIMPLRVAISIAAVILSAAAAALLVLGVF